MAHSLLFAQDVMDPFTALTSAPKQIPGTHISSPSKDLDRISLWLAQQPTQQQRMIPQMNSSIAQQGTKTEEDRLEYTFTTHGPDSLQHHNYPNMWNTTPSHMFLPPSLMPGGSSPGQQQQQRHSPAPSPFTTEGWGQLSGYSPLTQEPSLASSSYCLSDFNQDPHGLNSYTSAGSSTLMTPTTASDPSLSPLSGYSTSPRLPTPTTPMSPSQTVGQSPTSSFEGSGILVPSQDQGTSSDPNRKQYTHREQLHLFRIAMDLPLDGAGPFVPQQMYKPHTTSDRKRYVEEVLLEEPLYFPQSENPSQFGISLRDALHSRTKKLANRDQVVFEGRGPSVSIRLEWPGYRQWSRQIPTKDFRSPPGPITLAKLAKNVAKCVQRFMQDRKSLPLEEEADQSWRVGDGPNDIKLEDLVLVSIHHVSLGSWQPQLRLIRPPQQRFGRVNSQQRHRQGQVASAQSTSSAAPLTPTMLPPTPMSAAHALPRPPINMCAPVPNMTHSYHPQMLPHH